MKLKRFDELPAVPDYLEALALAPLTRRRNVEDAHTPVVDVDQPEAITAAVQWLIDEAPEAVEGDGGDDTTYKTANKLKDFGLSREKAFELLAEHWNDQKAHPPWDLDDLERKVENAYRYGTLPPGAGSAKAEFGAAVGESELREWRKALGLPESPNWQTGEKPQSRRGLYFVPFGPGWKQALTMAGEPLVKGLLDAGALSVIYGPSNSGKTFIAVDIGFKVATGTAWHGRKTRKGPVVYVAAEGGRGIFKRLAALKHHFKPDDETQFFVVPCPVDLLNGSGLQSDTARLIALIREVEAACGAQIELLVIDTLSRALAGGDENSSKDMGTFIKHVDALRAAIKAHLLIVHHTGKEAARGARGWSGIRAAVDTEIEILNNVLTVTKQRDLDPVDAIGFKVVQVAIGKDADEATVNSCVIEYHTPTEFDVELTPAEQQFFNALLKIAEANATEYDTEVTLSTKAIIEGFKIVRSGASDKALGQSTVKLRLSELSDKSSIRKLERGQYVIPIVRRGSDNPI